MKANWRWACGAIAWALTACQEAEIPEEPETAPPPAASYPWPEGPHPHATLEIRDLGSIEIEFFPERAPKAVANFIQLAREGFYDGTTFHRSIPEFMIQGGDPNTKNRDPRDDGKGGPGYTIDDEFNETPHYRGVVAMAREPYPNTGGSQFFIVLADAHHLDGEYTAFGRVTAGMDVVDAIASRERDVYGRHGPRDRPLEDVVIERVRVTTPPDGTGP